MKNVILFEDLDKFNYYLSILLIPFFKKIYFAEASFGINKTFFKRKLNKIYFQVGIKDQSGQLIQKAFYLRKYLIKKIIRENFKSEFFLEFLKLIRANEHSLKKLTISLENKIFHAQHEAIESKLYIYIKKNFRNKTFYIPSSQNSLLIMKEIKNDKLKIISLSVFIKIFFSNLMTIFKMSLKKKKSANIKENFNLENIKTEIGYFPHGGLKYGNFFKKTYFYQKSKDSILHKDNIDTISFNKFDKISKRFFSFYRLENTELGNMPIKINLKKIYLFSAFFLKNKKFVFKNRILLFKILFELYLSINKFNNFFKKKKYKYLFFDNDSIIPSGFLLSANINHIKTISIQDRLISYMYNHKCFFDLYLLAGKEFQKILTSKYDVSNYKTLGLTRVNLIKKSPSKKIEKYLNNEKGIITCLMLTPNSYWRTQINGEDGTSIKSSLDFCEKIVKLAKNFHNYNFIIKFKILDESNDHFFINSINKIISSSQNIYFDYNKDVSSANLVAHSKLVIGKYSTILDESLASGIDVLVDDEENFISSFSFFKTNRFHIIKNFDDLLFYSKNLLNRDGTFFENYKNNKNKYISGYLTNKGEIGTPKKIIEIIENFITKNRI